MELACTEPTSQRETQLFGTTSHRSTKQLDQGIQPRPMQQLRFSLAATYTHARSPSETMTGTELAVEAAGLANYAIGAGSSS